MLWFDMVVEFWCKSPSCKSGICSALLRLRTDFAETTSDNDVSLPEMFNSAVSYFQPHTTEHAHFPNAQSCTKSHFGPTHHLMTEFSGPSALGEQRYATERVPSIRSDWLKRPWSLGRDRKMVLKRWCTDFKTTKIARNITKSWKIYNLAEILTVRGCQHPTKFVTKADPCYIPRLWCASSGALPWRPIAVVFVKRSHQGDLEDRGGMMGHCWAWAQLPELWGYRIYLSLYLFGYRRDIDPPWISCFGWGWAGILFCRALR